MTQSRSTDEHSHQMLASPQSETGCMETSQQYEAMFGIKICITLYIKEMERIEYLLFCKSR